MSFKFVDRVRMSLSGSAGTGALTLNLPGAGFQSFLDAGMSYGDQTSYVIEDGTPLGLIWEIGKGTIHSNGTFSRDTIYQSSLGGTTPISATSAAVLSGSVLAEDLQNVYTNSFVSPPYVQSAGAFVSGAGAVSVTLPAVPTFGDTLIGVAYDCGSGSYTPPVWDNSWDYVTTNGEFSYAFRAVRVTDTTTSIPALTGGGDSGMVAVVEMSNVDLTRCGPQMISQRITNVMSNPTDIAQSVSAIPFTRTLYFYMGPDVTVTRAGDGSSALDINNGTSRIIVGYDVPTGRYDSVTTTVAGTGIVATMQITLAGTAT